MGAPLVSLPLDEVEAAAALLVISAEALAVAGKSSAAFTRALRALPLARAIVATSPHMPHKYARGLIERAEAIVRNPTEAAASLDVASAISAVEEASR